MKTHSIKLLPEELTNQIAAGEVVERPASVVKELLENALDAEATEVEITVEDGGQSLIRVRDNGVGIASDDLELAVTRHATSKLHDISGLSQISSYGFRGEALPSIASVSKFKIISKTRDEQSEATELNIEFAKIQGTRPASLKQGTLIEVRDLFFNIPARLKFLKTPATELKKATELFLRLALVAQNTDLSFYAGTRLVHSFKKHEDLLQRLGHIWAPAVVEALLPVKLKMRDISVSGFVSHPRSHQPRADRMLFYVNGRAVTDKILMRAVRQAFQGKLTTKDYPQCVLCLDLPACELDVNVHPAKSEVRFRDEQEIFSAVYRAINLALEDNNKFFSAKQLNQTQEIRSNQEIDGFQQAQFGDLYKAKPQGFWGELDKEQALSFAKQKPEEESPNSGDWQSTSSQAQEMPKQAIDGSAYADQQAFHAEHKEVSTPSPLANTSYTKDFTTTDKPASNTFKEPYSPPQALTDESIPSKDFNQTESFGSEFDAEYIQNTSSIPDTSPSRSNNTPYANTDTDYQEQDSVEENQRKSASLPAGLVYLGQIAKTYLMLKQGDGALILLDQHAVHERILYEKIKAGIIQSQSLLLPLEINLHESEFERLQECFETLQTLGFSLSLAPLRCVIDSIPHHFDRSSAQAFIKDVLSEKNTDLEHIWIRNACAAALKANTALNTTDALKLIGEWLQTKEPDYCPHGRPCVLHFDSQNLEQMFKRKM